MGYIILRGINGMPAGIFVFRADPAALAMFGSVLSQQITDDIARVIAGNPDKVWTAVELTELVNSSTKVAQSNNPGLETVSFIGGTLAGAAAGLLVAGPLGAVAGLLAGAIYGNIFDFIKGDMTDQNILDWLKKQFGGGKNQVTDPEMQREIDSLIGRYGLAKNARVDPLILDLDGDGVETTGEAGAVYFDHDGNGFAERSNWAGADDGMLVIDKNGNGTIDNGGELFGNHTRLANGQLAANGFAALADYDSDKDGDVDAGDSAYGSLKIWRDANANGKTDAGELYTLAQLGIKSLKTGYTNSSQIDANNNAHSQRGSYELENGQTRAMHDVWFNFDPTRRIETGLDKHKNITCSI